MPDYNFVTVDGSGKIADAVIPAAIPRLDGGGKLPASTIPAGSAISGEHLLAAFAFAGNVTTAASLLAVPMARDGRVTRVLCSLGGASAGSSVIADVFVNDTSIFPGGTNRPSFNAGVTTQSGGLSLSSVFAGFNRIRAGVVQIGSTTPGSDLVVAVYGEWTE